MMNEDYSMMDLLADYEEEQAQHYSQKRKLIGTFAKVIAPLRPQGYIRLEGKAVAVSSEGQYIPRGEEVQIIGVRDDQFIVR